MAQYVVTPWRSVDELLEVRDMIFKDFSDSLSISPSSAAVQRIHVWKERGNLPHAVESTGQLLEALLVNERESQMALQSESHDADSFLVRATHTAAITRFVTGFADLGRSRSGPGQSMLEVARDIDLPVAFVELRHEATHEGMPNLARLRKAATDALIWLKRVYWDKIEAIENDSAPMAHHQLGFPTADQEALHGVADIRTALKDYRRARKAGLQSGKGTDELLDETTKLRLADLASSMQRGNRILAESFCTPSILLPTTQVSTPEQMAPAYRLWDDLLQYLASRSRTFFKPFLKVMIERCSQAGERPQYDGLVYWILHLFESPSWRTTLGARYPTLLRYSIEQCLLNPSQTTQQLATELLGHAQGTMGATDVLKTMSEAAFEGFEYQEQAAQAPSVFKHSKHQLRNTLVS